jgi:hypothetical protein
MGLHTSQYEGIPMTVMLWADKRHILTKCTIRRGSFMDEHYTTIKTDNAGCYMCRTYGSRYIKQPKAI